jgi:hypothetical protein
VIIQDVNPKNSLPGHLPACLYGAKQAPNMMMCWGPAPDFGWMRLA